MLAEKVGKKWGKWETNSRQLKIFRSENRIEVQHKQQIGRQVGDNCSIMRSTASSGGDKCRIMWPRAPRAYGDTVGDRWERRGIKVRDHAALGP